MSNDFYNWSQTLTAGTTAKANDVESKFQSVATGLDKLPTEANIKNGAITYAADTGSANAYLVAMPYTRTSYVTGMEVVMKAANANTGASTINVDSIGVKSIKRADGATALSAGDIPAGAIVTLRYDGTNFLLQDAYSAASVAAAAASAAAAAASATSAAAYIDAIRQIASPASVSSGTHDVDPADGYWHKITAAGDFTLTFSFTTGETDGVILEALNFGAHTVTWPTITWLDGAAPSFTASGTDVIIVMQGYNDTLYGKVSGLDV